MKAILVAFVICACLASSSSAYLEPSFRLKALGEDLVGLIPDAYSDIFRNPAYLGRVGLTDFNFEYRNEAGRRYLLGWLQPVSKASGKAGTVGIFLKGNHSSRKSSLLRDEFYEDYYGFRTLMETQDNKNRSQIYQTSIKYGLPLGENTSLGLSLNYYQSETGLELDREISAADFDYGLGRYWRILLGISDQNRRTFDKYYQSSFGLLVGRSEDREFSLHFLLRRANLDVSQEDLETRVETVIVSDTSGLDTLLSVSSRVRRFSSPIQKVTTIGLGAGLRITTETIHTISLLLNLSFSHLEDKSSFELLQFSNGAPGSFNQSWSDEAKRDWISLEFGAGGESDTLRFSKLYLALKSKFEFEKGSIPSPSAIPQQKGFHNSSFQILLPVGIEVFPVRGWSLRGSVATAYTFSKFDRYEPERNTFYTDSNKGTKTIYNLGFGYMLLNRILAEAYVVNVSNFTQLDYWSVSASYSF